MWPGAGLRVLGGVTGLRWCKKISRGDHHQGQYQEEDIEGHGEEIHGAAVTADEYAARGLFGRWVSSLDCVAPGEAEAVEAIRVMRFVPSGSGSMTISGW